MTLTPKQLQKLAAMLGMMGSAHDGEILAAAKAAHKVMSEAHLTWSQLVLNGTHQTYADGVRYGMAQGFARGKAEGLEEGRRLYEGALKAASQDGFRRGMDWGYQHRQNMEDAEDEEGDDEDEVEEEDHMDEWPGFARVIRQKYFDRLNGWERNFLESWGAKPALRTPSEKEYRIFAKLAQKFGERLPNAEY